MTKRIVDVKNNSKGNVAAVRFEGNSTFTPLDTAVRMTEQGQVEHTHVVHPASGQPHLRSNPNGLRRDNLDDMAKD